MAMVFSLKINIFLPHQKGLPLYLIRKEVYRNRLSFEIFLMTHFQLALTSDESGLSCYIFIPLLSLFIILRIEVLICV